MKKAYTSPEMEIIELKNSDILTDSHDNVSSGYVVTGNEDENGFDNGL